LKREQEERDRKIGQQRKDYQLELTIMTAIGTFDKESVLKNNLADAFAENE
jgi:hypothetical protein